MIILCAATGYKQGLRAHDQISGNRGITREM